MRTPLLLRIASIIMFLFAAGHSLGGSSSWSPVGETDVLRAMRSVTFHVGGVVVSWILIFPVPTIFSVILAACLGAAFFTVR